MKKFVFTVISLLTIGAAALSGCMTNSEVNSDGDKARGIVNEEQTLTEQGDENQTPDSGTALPAPREPRLCNEDDGDGLTPVPHKKRRCPRGRNGNCPSPTPIPEPEPAPTKPQN